MNEWDRDNLEFIKGCDSGEFDDWMDQATNDDIEYALELIKMGKQELAARAFLLAEDLEINDFSDARSFIERIRK